MTKFFEPYSYNPDIARPVTEYPQLFSLATKTFVPLSEAKSASKFDGIHMEEVLNSITLATEAGVVPRDTWVKYFFGTKERCNEFFDELHAYGESNRVTDRWWNALDHIADVGEEYGFTTFEQISDRMREVAEESGQL